jgi:adenine C2-methylase RlmN of 23S rRNA A2503 and tRNA A37
MIRKMISGTHHRLELLGKSKEELRAFCVALGEPAFRGAQIYHALYSESKFDMAQITNLPAALRKRLSKEARVTLPEVKQRFASTDGSVRYLFALNAEENDKEFSGENTERTESAEKSGKEKASR